MYKPTKSDQDRFDELDNSLDQIDLTSYTDNMSVNLTNNNVFDLNTISTINLSSLTPSVSDTITINSGAYNPWTTSTNNGKLTLQGEDADIEINGVSLSDRLKILEERLNILVPNAELENEWDELRELGELYRKKEIEFKEKSEMWKKLKSLPPVDTSEW